MLERIGSRTEYDSLRRTFRWERPERFNFGFDVVDRWAETRPDRVALQWEGPGGSRASTWSLMAERSARFARAAAALGLRRGDRVLVILPRVVEWWESLIGLMKAGLVAMPGTSLLTSKDIAYRITQSDAAAVVTDAEGAEKLDSVTESLPSLRRKILVSGERRDDWHDLEELVSGASDSQPLTPTRGDEPALLYFTSGTTGLPKMTLHTHASYGIGHRLTGRLWLDLHEDDLHWNISDTGWAKAAWSSLFGPWSCGAAVFAHYSPGKFHPDEVFSILSEHPITTMCAAPTIFRRLVQLDLGAFRPKALRHCVAAGEPLNPEVISTWRQATGLTIRDGYGQTETVLLCGNFPGIEVRSGSMGLPTPGFDLAVIDDAGQRLPAGEEGHIAVRVDPDRPVGMLNEYWRNAEAMRQSFRDGWYLTGDCGRVDADGYFWFVSRADDVISSSAYRIGPFEVESALLEHPSVAEAAVVGKRDELRGEIVKAFVVLARGWQGSDELVRTLQEHVKQTTAPYKYPREIEFMDELPKTVSGKIRRNVLRQQGSN